MPRRKGIVLSWQGLNFSGGAIGWIRFDRTRTGGPASQPATRENSGSNPLTGHKTAAEPAQQVFRVPENSGELHPSALDITAHTGNSYGYIPQRVQQFILAGHTVEMASLPSAPTETSYRDVFPPPVPMGLVSAADTASKAIDLDWTPDVDSGLAGYIVYRRAAGADQTPERISPAGQPVTTAEWSDTTAVPGQRYAYSVSAVDLSGNESQRSTEIEDEWNTPNPPPSPQPDSSQPNPHP
jgi:bacillopeptidase F